MKAKALCYLCRRPAPVKGDARRCDTCDRLVCVACKVTFVRTRYRTTYYRGYERRRETEYFIHVCNACMTEKRAKEKRK